MSVSEQVELQHHSWNGYDDPGLPTRVWFAQGQATGDASGDTLTLQFNFATLVGAVNEQFYNMEMLNIRKSSIVAASGQMNVINMGFAASRTYPIVLVPGDASIATASFGPGQMPMPLWLGAQNTGGGNAAIQVDFDNEDLITFRATMMGYMWDPRSKLTPGGLRRPAEALFGN